MSIILAILYAACVLVFILWPICSDKVIAWYQWRKAKKQFFPFIGQELWWDTISGCFCDKDKKRIPLLSRPQICVNLEVKNNQLIYIPCKIKNFIPGNHPQNPWVEVEILQQEIPLQIKLLTDNVVCFNENAFGITHLLLSEMDKKHKVGDTVRLYLVHEEHNVNYNISKRIKKVFLIEL